MSFAYHGNYCGPGWSAGKMQTSVVSNVLPLDTFDETCKKHDAAYATGADRTYADAEFAFTNLTSGNPKAAFAGALVGLQGVSRLLVGPFAALSPAVGALSSLYNYSQSGPPDIPLELKPTNNLFPMNVPRKSKPSLMPLTKAEKKRIKSIQLDRNNIPKPRTRKSVGLPPVEITTAPVSIGTTVRSASPIIRHTPNGVTLTSREFLNTVQQYGSANWQVGAICPLHPAFYVASAMGQYVRVYQHYRFKRINVHFVTKQATSTNGEIALV